MLRHPETHLVNIWVTQDMAKLLHKIDQCVSKFMAKIMSRHNQDQGVIGKINIVKIFLRTSIEITY